MYIARYTPLHIRSDVIHVHVGVHVCTVDVGHCYSMQNVTLITTATGAAAVVVKLNTARLGQVCGDWPSVYGVWSLLHAIDFYAQPATFNLCRSCMYTRQFVPLLCTSPGR